MQFDRPLDELRVHEPLREEPSGFDAFWQETLGEARAFPLDATFDPVAYGIKTAQSHLFTFHGSCTLQSLCGAQAHQDVRVQRARGWR